MGVKYLCLIICMVVIAEVSATKWHDLLYDDHEKKSSACVGATNLICTKHKLTCSQHQQIKINSAFYGFVKRSHGCPTNTMTCSSQKGCDCEWYHGDCGIPYKMVDEAEVIRSCSGQRSCSPNSATSNDNSRCSWSWLSRKYNSQNSYTEIDYECIKAQEIQIDSNGPKVIKGTQIVLNASKDESCTYSVNRWWPRSFIFYQTNRKQKAFMLHGHATQSGVEYTVRGTTKFTIHPNTDMIIVLAGRGMWSQSEIKVNFECSKTGNPSTPKPLPSSTTRSYHPKSTTRSYHPKSTTRSYHPKSTTRSYHPKSTTRSYHPKSTTRSYHTNPSIRPSTSKRPKPSSTSIRPRPEFRTTTTKRTTTSVTKTTTKAIATETKTTTEAFVMEEVTRNVEDEIIKKEDNEKVRPQASTALEDGSTFGIIGGLVVAIVALIILLIVVIICKRRRRTKEKTVVVVSKGINDKGINNPGYEVSFIDPKLLSPPPSYEEVAPRNGNYLPPPPARTAGDYDNNVMNNVNNDVKDAEYQHLAGLDVKEVVKDGNYEDLYNHMSDTDVQDVPKDLYTTD